MGKEHSPEQIIRKLQEAKATAYLLQMRSLLVLWAMEMRPLPPPWRKLAMFVGDTDPDCLDSQI
jgi:hypothetical protein